MNNVLYSGNPDDIPLTDIEAAAGGYFAQSLLCSDRLPKVTISDPLPSFWEIIVTSLDLPYDTDIPDDGADIPEDPNEAFRANAMKITRINSVNQVWLSIYLSYWGLKCIISSRKGNHCCQSVIMLMKVISLTLIYGDWYKMGSHIKLYEFCVSV